MPRQQPRALAPYSSHQAPGMTFHPPLPGPPPNLQQGQWVNFFPPRPPGQHTPMASGSSIPSITTSTPTPAEEGEDELQDDLPELPTSSQTGRRSSSRQGTSASQSQTSQTSQTTTRKGTRSKGKAKPASTRSRSSSIAGVGPQPPVMQQSEGMIGPTTTALFLLDPYQPPIQLKGVSKGGLLAAPPGAILDVNDLLILHPPAIETQGLGHTSQYEMYTCRVCSKTYDGKNARSVARRHLQDKHGVPLSAQKRRSRWDFEPDRPKSKKDAKERSLKSKREWANKNRQIQKVEKTHAPFLERFGPEGILTPYDVRLVAPMFKGAVTHSMKNARYLDGTSGDLIIPEEILEAVRLIKEQESDVKPLGTDEIEMMDEQPEVTVDMDEGRVIVQKGKGKKQQSFNANRSSSSSRPSSKSQRSTWSGSPAPQYLPQPSAVTPRTSGRNDISQEPYAHHFPYGWQNGNALQPASMHLINGQYHFTFPPNFQEPEEADEEDEHADHRRAEEEEESVQSSPEPTGQMMPLQRWVPTQNWQAAPEEPGAGARQLELEPALDITDQWRGLQLDGWRSSEGDSDDPAEGVRGKESSVETEGEAVAAESLLNLHSTPLRGPDENGRNELQLAQAQALVEAHRGTVDKASQEYRDGAGFPFAPGWSERLLEAPRIVSPSRTRPGRAHSFIQPFRDPRPEVTRSLSFDQRPTLDDPFILPDTPLRPSSASGRPTPALSSSFRRSKRHTISMPSPSPLPSSNSALKKRKDAPTSPATATATAPAPAPGSAARSALRPLSTNLKSTHAGSYATPVKPNSAHVPSSLTREWLQLSSPGNADAAASLGLVPTHLAPATPGLRGAIGAETPEMTILEARAKKRRSEGTPRFGMGMSVGMGMRGG